MRLIKVFLGLLACAVGVCYAWDEDPRHEAHTREQDRVFRDAQSHTGAKEYERDADRPAWNCEEGEDSNSSEASNELGTIGPPDRDR